MKDLLKLVTIRGVVAVILILACMGIFYLSASGYFKATEATQTQINQGCFGALMLVLSHFFGTSHSDRKAVKDGE